MEETAIVLVSVSSTCCHKGPLPLPDPLATLCTFMMGNVRLSSYDIWKQSLVWMRSSSQATWSLMGHLVWNQLTKIPPVLRDRPNKWRSWAFPPRARYQDSRAPSWPVWTSVLGAVRWVAPARQLTDLRQANALRLVAC